MRQVDENTMTFNSSRRIAGKGKGGVIVEDPNFDRKLDLILKAYDLLMNYQLFFHSHAQKKVIVECLYAFFITFCNRGRVLDLML